nr:MAG TPA: hypothetical protein [Caudoviricetes sp.]
MRKIQQPCLFIAIKHSLRITTFIYAEWATNTIPERGIRPAYFGRFLSHSAP